LLSGLLLCPERLDEVRMFVVAVGGDPDGAVERFTGFSEDGVSVGIVRTVALSGGCPVSGRTRSVERCRR
jgi:hypothetical protein